MNRHPTLAARRAAVIGVAAALAACAVPPRPGGTSSSRSRPPAPPPTLAQERQRLSELFEGTPVVLKTDRDGSLRAEVPLRYCFDPARSVVKPPLAALLDRLATSPATRRATWLVSAPADPKAKGFALALERAASARDHLIGKGADATRFSISALGAGSGPAVVRIVVAEAPSAPRPR